MSWPQRAKSFYRDVRTEMKKVTTPSMKEVRATTTVVIIAVAIFGLYFFVIDLAIGRGVNWALKYFTH
jgi:preprotein translocase subunit SecE